MAENDSSRRFLWNVLARTVAQHAHFHIIDTSRWGDEFSLSGEIAPWVHVSFRRVTNKETAPSARLGVRVAEFERDWRVRLRRTAVSDADEFPPLDLHFMNISSLMPRPWSPNSPTEEDITVVRDWLDRVFDYATRRLPSSVAALAAAVEAGKIADDNVEAYLGHPVKVRGLVSWLQRAHGIDISERVLPLLGDRIEPYDVDTMLGPPLK
jgi:hypothetical protein